MRKPDEKKVPECNIPQLEITRKDLKIWKIFIF